VREKYRRASPQNKNTSCLLPFSQFSIQLIRNELLDRSTFAVPVKQKRQYFNRRAAKCTIQDRAWAPDEPKANVLDKSQPKSGQSVRRLPVLRPFAETYFFFRSLQQQQRQFIRNNLLHRRLLVCVLLSSKNANISKVVPLIAIQDPSCTHLFDPGCVLQGQRKQQATNTRPQEAITWQFCYASGLAGLVFGLHIETTSF